MDLYIQIIVVACLTGMTSLLAHRSAAVFHDGIRPILPQLIEGYMNRREAGSIAFGLLPEPVPGLDRGYDCILPVPASSKKRGYNVPERMAQPLARAVGVPVVTDALTRARSTRRQEGLSLDERLANVAGAFRVARPEAVEGKRILLVDDVLTTGATASACAQALLDAGAQSVFAVALATVEFPQPVGSTTAIAENEEEI